MSNAPQSFSSASFAVASHQGPGIAATVGQPLLYTSSTITGKAITGYAAGVFSLSAGHTFKLTAGVNTATFTGATGNMSILWATVAGTGLTSLTNGIVIPVTATVGFSGQSGPAVAILTTLVDTTIQVQPGVLTAFTSRANLWAMIEVVGS